MVLSGAIVHVYCIVYNSDNMQIILLCGSNYLGF